MSRGTRPGKTSLFVRNVHVDTRAEDLRKMFGKYGEVSDVYIPLDYYSREARGFAYIQFDDMRDADDAVHYLDGVNLHGRSLEVQLAEGGRKTSHQMRSRDGGSERGGRRGTRSPSPRRRSRSPRGRRRSRSPRGYGHSSRRRRSYSRSRSRSYPRGRSRTPSIHARSASRERSPY